MKPYIVLLSSDYNRKECERMLQGKFFNSISEVKNLCESLGWNKYYILSLRDFIDDINNEIYPTKDWVINININQF